MSSEWIETTVGGKTVYEPSPTPEPTTNSSDRFSQSKKEWAAELDDEATAYLCEHFDVPESAVIDYEGLSDGEYTPEDLLRPLQHLDYAGIDKMVLVDGIYKGVAFRFRPNSEQYDVDFSYCTDNGTDEHTAEYYKHLGAHEDGGIYPTIYAFGITNQAETEIEEFHLIKMDPFLDCIKTGVLNPAGPYERDGGVWAKYFSIDELRDTGCILQSWGDSE